jgi:hypothetical protein
LKKKATFSSWQRSRSSSTHSSRNITHRGYGWRTRRSGEPDTFVWYQTGPE